MLREWVQRRGAHLDLLHRLEGPPEILECSRCKTATPDEGLWRCVTCLASPLFCQNCAVSEHNVNIFHWLEKWTGTSFRPSSLYELGFVIHLGHAGNQCPLSTPAPYNPFLEDQEPQWEDEPEFDSDVTHDDTDSVPQLHMPETTPLCNTGDRTMVIIDVTGVHRHFVRWCCCADAEPVDTQLMSLRLFPSTFRQPSTAFSFALLDDFVLEASECQTSAMRYFRKLRRLTSNAFPHTIPVCCSAIAGC